MSEFSTPQEPLVATQPLVGTTDTFLNNLAKIDLGWALPAIEVVQFIGLVVLASIFAFVAGIYIKNRLLYLRLLLWVPWNEVWDQLAQLEEKSEEHAKALMEGESEEGDKEYLSRYRDEDQARCRADERAINELGDTLTALMECRDKAVSSDSTVDALKGMYGYYKGKMDWYWKAYWLLRVLPTHVEMLEIHVRIAGYEREHRKCEAEAEAARRELEKV
ncbi:hypothetical protein C8R44DRAFT_726993 [Mycena epipterygia]|nr:hypothetical protein C8R44DRAFT_726993 [Mycena epipterygia]